MTWTDRYRERQNAENLARQAEPVQTKAKEILETLSTLEKYLYSAIDPEENGGEWAARLIEHAHELLDQAHYYRAALAFNPPPKNPGDKDEDDLQSNR